MRTRTRLPLSHRQDDEEVDVSACACHYLYTMM